jgi:acetyl-CoA C-acetyltransferase/acetyl-CoA acyltransferase
MPLSSRRAHPDRARLQGRLQCHPGATLGALSLRPPSRAGIEPGEVDDVVWGAALQQGAQAGNIARQVALRAGLPVTHRA